MDFLGSISNFNYNPIQVFNNQLHQNKAFEIPKDDDKSFENILQSKIDAENEPEKNAMDNFMEKMEAAFSGGLNSVNNDALTAERAEEILASGGDISPHEVMIAAEKSQLSMQMAIQIRNRLINAYSEIHNMQL